jgi:hypothetical protein
MPEEKSKTRHRNGNGNGNEKRPHEESEGVLRKCWGRRALGMVTSVAEQCQARIHNRGGW